LADRVDTDIKSKMAKLLTNEDQSKIYQNIDI